ncbi:hypothetical protein ANCCEY_02451 [Ancylostoma ceylanicum]|uniref:Uncharacterized protein n=1 Tax=Ancylostoma ceylanicum TaxID=53326 RepID=A0A0D6M7U2_9BILA|nr:hypothetical protein ANCCEY_02451 [Ancylostoma ceylanicum]
MYTIEWREHREIQKIFRNLHSHTTEDVFFVVIADRPIGEKRRKALAQAEIIHAVQWSSRDTSLVEFVARLANRIRVMPALFAVLDEKFSSIFTKAHMHFARELAETLTLQQQGLVKLG